MIEKPNLVVIDGDLIAYKSSAANEKRGVVAIHKDTAEQYEFDTATQFKEWAGSDKDDYELVPTQKSGPLENAFHIVNHMIKNITNACGVDSYHIVVSGDTNFRLELPLPTKYKDNRKESVRPLQLKDCKNYLINTHNAEISDGVEADDVLISYAYAGNIQGTIDKDGNGPGPWWIYNWDTMTEPEYISGFGELILVEKVTARKKANGEFVVDKSVKGKGRIWTYYQMLFGDAADCYKPCELAKVKFGEIGAYNLLKGCKSDLEALEVIAKQYQVWYPKPITYRAWDDSLQENKSWLDIWQLYADCVWMRRWDDDRFDVRKVLDKVGIKYE